MTYAMPNLARRDPDPRVDERIKIELTRARIDLRELDHDERKRSEVPATIGGRIGAFTLQRAWMYWVVKGPMPLDAARALYADPIGADDVRVAGHCGCPPPDEWARDGFVDSYHIDSVAGLRLFADAVRNLDRPAPTPTPAPGLDLDAVERDVIGSGTASESVVAARRYAPALIAEVRSLRAQVCRLVSGQAIESDALCQHHDADVASLAEVAKLRAKLAEAKRLGRDAIQIASDAIDNPLDATAMEDLGARQSAIAAALEAL